MKRYVAALAFLGALVTAGFGLATHTSVSYDPPAITVDPPAECVTPPAITADAAAETTPSGHVVDPAAQVVQPAQVCIDPAPIVTDPPPVDVPIPDPPATTTTPPTTTAPPPPPPPGGTTLTFTDEQWRCVQPIASYATQGLPLTVILNFTRQFPEPAGSGAAFLGAGCVGDGTPATDLRLFIRGDGRTFGPGGDAIRIANAHPGASNLEIEGQADCGPRYGAAHQDGVQVLGGTNITFRNYEIGHYDEAIATCHAAGGAFFYSGDSVNVDVEGGKFIGCNHGLLAGWPSPQANVTGASFRTGGRPVCVQPETFAVSQPCDIRQEWLDAGGVATGLTCERWNGSGWSPQFTALGILTQPRAASRLDYNGDNRVTKREQPH